MVARWLRVIYSGIRMGNWRLWRAPAGGGSPSAVTEAGMGAQFPALAPSSRQLAYTKSESSAAVWRAQLGLRGTAAIIRSAGREYSPSYSPDGKHIVDVSDQTGADEIWVCDADGDNRVQATHLKGTANPTWPQWSPDGKWILYESRETNSPSVDIIPATGGEPRRVLSEASNPSWSQDGKKLYFVSRNAVWRAAVNGSDRQMITSQGGFGVAQPEESTDGKYVYYRKWRSIWRAPSSGGAEEETIQPERGIIFGGPQVTKKGVYYVEMGNGRRAAALAFYDFSTQKSSILFETDRVERSGLAVSPDGKYALYPRVRRERHDADVGGRLPVKAPSAIDHSSFLTAITARPDRSSRDPFPPGSTRTAQECRRAGDRSCTNM